MSEPIDGQHQRLATNPFSPTAVARVSESPSDMVSVSTQAIREAIHHLDEYLSIDPEDVAPVASHAGNVIAITGDYGTGKTHLAAMLMNHARDKARSGAGGSVGENVSGISNDAIRAVYIDAANETFRSLYRRFMDQLPKGEVYSRVREYYADIVANRLNDAELADQARKVIREYNVDVRDMTNRLGLSESSLLQELRRKLKDVTDNEAFAVVLPLLLRPGFDEAAWEWLRGERPHPLLTERGITSAISGDVAALEALGVIALLYGQQNRRFILIIDELDKLLPVSDPPSSTAMLAFRKLLTVFVKARGLLVLVGLAESFDLLTDDTQQRIGAFISMSSFDNAATCNFIKRCQRRVQGTERLWPFTAEAVDKIVALTEGNPRKVELYCRHLYRMAALEADGQVEITTEMVHEAARTHFGMDTQKRVDAAVRRALGNAGWECQRDYLIHASSGRRVDFWIPVVGESIGCAIFLTEAVIDDQDVDRLTEHAEAVRAVAPRCEMLLVVSEALAPQYVPALTNAFEREPLIYHPHSFAEDLVARVKVMTYRLDQMVGSDASVVVREGVERIIQQHSWTLQLLERIRSELRRLQASSDQGLGSVRHALEALSRAFYGSHVSEADLADVAPMSVLPERVNQLFEKGLDALKMLGTEAELVEGAFLIDVDRRTSVEAAVAAIRTMTRPPDPVLAALGSAALLRTTTEAFRRGVGEWFRSCVPSDRRLRTSDVQKLEALCETYDAIYGDLPLFPLDGLARLKVWAPGGFGAAEKTSWTERLGDVRRRFEYLGADVRQEVLNSFPR